MIMVAWMPLATGVCDEFTELQPCAINCGQRPACGAPKLGLGHVLVRWGDVTIRPAVLFHLLDDDDLESLDAALCLSEEHNVTFAGDLCELEAVRAEGAGQRSHRMLFLG
jgi:hypothetical protein